VAQVLGFAGGKEAQQLRPHLEKADVAGEPVLLPSAAEPGQQGLNRLRHAGAATADREAAEAGERHQFEGRFEHQADRDRLRPLAQPLHLIEVEDQAGEDGVGARQRSAQLAGTCTDVPVAEDLDRKLGAAGHGLVRRLAVQTGVEGFEPGDQNDAFHGRAVRATSQFWGADGPLVRRRSGGRWRTGFGRFP